MVSLTYITDTPFGSGKAIDLADGHVEVSTGESEDTFDGGAAFSVSAWVKGWPATDLSPVITKGSVMSLYVRDGLKAWFDASSAKNASTSTSADTPPTDGGQANKWKDLSGNGYHATTKVGAPLWDADGFNGKPAIDFTSDSYTLENSASDFDGWSDLVVIGALYQHQYSHFTSIFGKGNQTGWHNNNGHDFSWALVMHRNDISSHKIWGPAINTSTGGNTYKTTSSDAIWSHSGFGGGPSIVSIRYSSTNSSSMTHNLVGRVNGVNFFTANLTGSLKSNSTTPVSISGTGNGGSTWKGRIAEALIYNADLGLDNIQKVEGYLAHKWGLSLPDAHPFKALDGWSIQKSVGVNDLSVNISNVGNTQSALHSESPATDNEWHHIVSSYDGVTRKIFIDGTSAYSAGASGLSTPSNKALVFGALDLNNSAGSEEEIKNVAAAAHSGIKLDDVRFYNSGLSDAEITELYNYGKGDLAKVGGFSSVPTTISGTAGTALSSTVTANFPMPYIMHITCLRGFP